MCGLFGWQIKKGSKFYKDAVFQELLATLLAGYNDSRGGDSWGVWTPDGLTKGWGKAEPYADWFGRFPMAWGHTRKATHGKVNMSNAHPFYEKGWWLAHNGVLSNHTELNKKYGRKHEVDSQHLLSALVEKKPFNEISGYGAVLFMHQQKQTRPFIAKLTDSGSMEVRQMEDDFLFWTSSNYHADEVVKTLGLKQKNWYKIKPGKTYFAEDAELYVAKDMPSLKLKENTSYDWRSGYEGGSSGVKVTKSEKESTTESFRKQWTREDWEEMWDDHTQSGWYAPTPPSPHRDTRHLHSVPPSPVVPDVVKPSAIMSIREHGQSVEKNNLYIDDKKQGLFVYPETTIAANETGSKLMDMELGSRSRCYCDDAIGIHYKYKVDKLTWKCIHLLNKEGRGFIQNLTPDTNPEDPMVKSRNFDKLLMSGFTREDLVKCTPAELMFAVKDLMGISGNSK